MILWNKNLLLGFAPNYEENFIKQWAIINDFTLLGDNDIKKIQEYTPYFFVKNPNTRLPEQLIAFVEKNAQLQSSTILKQWKSIKELATEILDDNPKDWFNIDPKNFIGQKSYANKFKVEWKYNCFEKFNDFCKENKLEELTIDSLPINKKLFSASILFLNKYNNQKQELYEDDYSIYNMLIK